jgi:myo-inositol-1(or 4)-monophosphatase
MHPMVNIAVRAARSAGNVIVRHMDRLDTLTIESKGRNDFVSEVDRMAEQEIIQVLRKAYPDHAILGEETGLSEGDEFQWVIDPLDGTTNFLHGVPHFAVSIALRQRGKLEVGVIYDPVRQELWTTNRGGGATLEGRRIRMSNKQELEGALLGTGFPFKAPQHMDAYLSTFKALSKHATDVRRAGAAALDLAYVAAGRLDGFWEIGLQPWDMAAGILLIQEAGGYVGDFAGGANHFKSGNVVAGNQKVFSGIVREIRPHLTPALMK